MNRVKRLFGIGGILVLILVLLVMMTSAETNIVDEGQCGEQVYWVLDNQGVLTISGSGDMYDYGTDWNWDGHRENIISAVITDGVTSIGNTAFYYCSNLTSVNIPESVTKIGHDAFFYCSSMTNINIPNGVTRIEDWTFSGCSSLSDIIIPNGVTSIGQEAFADCNNLTSIFIPDSVVSIGNAAFTSCDKITDVIVSNGFISEYAFSFCDSLKSVTIADGGTGIDQYAFLSCGNLEKVTIPQSVIYISENAFDDCSPSIYCDEYSYVDSWATKHGLSVIYLGSAGSTIVDSGKCGDQVYWTLDDQGLLTVSGSGSMYDNLYGLEYQKDIISVVITDGVTSIGSSAFYDCSSLTSINIPDGVTSISNSAFRGCSKLTSINIPDGVTIIGNCTFYCCFGLQKIAIPESVVCIYENAFTNSYPTVYCYEFSYADGWATEEGMTICYLDSEPLPVQMQLPESSILPKGQTATMLVNIFPDGIYDLVWTSSDPSIVSVDNGKLTGHAKGTVTITVSCTRNDESELEASSLVTCYVPLESFTLCPAEVWVVAKESYQVQPVIVPTDAEEPFTWKSSNTAIATVSELGLVTTKAVGDVTITATSRSGLTQTMLLHCCYPVLSIAFEPAELQMSTDPVQLQATVTDTKGGTYVNKLITFTTSDPDIVTIDENGMLYPHKAGTAEITATSSNGKTATCTVTVGVDGHIPVTTIEAIDPTCTADGRTERIVCSDCGAVLSESVIIPALGHDTVTHEAQEPTCTDIGWNAYETCSRCDYSTYVEIPALEHDIQAYEVQEPTCTEDGHEAYEACSRCDYTTCVIIPALGHDTVTHEAQAPTCTEIGWKAYETCSRCDYSTYAELPALGHTVVTDSYIAPTRTTGGMTAGSHCSVCNEILEGNEYIAPLSDAPIVIVPEAVEGLGEEAYMGSGVVCVRLPDGCKYLGSRAFAQCTSLQVIEIPASVTDIATDAFEGTTGFVIITGYNSTAMNYAKEHNIRCQIDTWPTTD